jgi:hypothetical protein
VRSIQPSLVASGYGMSGVSKYSGVIALTEWTPRENSGRWVRHVWVSGGWRQFAAMVAMRFSAG